MQVLWLNTKVESWELKLSSSLLNTHCELHVCMDSIYSNCYKEVHRRQSHCQKKLFVHSVYDLYIRSPFMVIEINSKFCEHFCPMSMLFFTEFQTARTSCLIRSSKERVKIYTIASFSTTKKNIRRFTFSASLFIFYAWGCANV